MKHIYLLALILILSCLEVTAGTVICPGLNFETTSSNTAKVRYHEYYDSGSSPYSITIRSGYGKNTYSGDIIIPEQFSYDGVTYSVTEIGSCTFCNYKWSSTTTTYEGGKITSVDIPKTITTIGGSAFRKNTQLTKIICRVLEPINISGKNVFTDVDKSACTLYVPQESIELYQNATEWQDFIIKSIDELDSENDDNITSDNFNFGQRSAIVNTHSDFLLPLVIDNKSEVSAMEFDLVLPAGVTLVGENPVIASNRGAELNITTTTNESDTIHVAVAGSLVAGKGQFATISLNTPKSDYYNLELINVKVTTKGGKEITLDDSELQFVANHKKGDYNEDGAVDIVDAQDLMEYVLGI